MDNRTQRWALAAMFVAALAVSACHAKKGSAPPAPAPQVPVVSFGLALGNIGNTVAVPVLFESRGQEVVTISPLEMTWDPASLSFAGCVNMTSNKGLHSGSPEPGLARAVLYGNLKPIADGILMHCKFTILPSATPGLGAPVHFLSAGLSDSQFNESQAVGNDGAVLVE